MRHTVRSIGAAFVIAAGVVAATATPAASAPSWEIDRVVYNPPGTDTRTNSHLNLETVKIVNRTTATRDLRGYTLRDAQNHVYTFRTTTRVAPGASLYVHTGKGTNNTAHRYWGMGNYVWNNTGDTATLRNAPGTRIDYCRWTTAGSGVSNC